VSKLKLLAKAICADINERVGVKTGIPVLMDGKPAILLTNVETHKKPVYFADTYTDISPAEAGFNIIQRYMNANWDLQVDVRCGYCKAREAIR